MAAVAAEVLDRVLHRRDVADDVHARRVDVHQEHRGALVRARVGVGDRHHDQEVRDRAVRGEPLVPVDDPFVTLAHGRGGQQRRVGAGGLGLGHRERASQVTREQRMQVALLLVRRTREREHLAVAGVRRGVAEHRGRVRRGAEDLVHEAEPDLAEALPAEVRRQVRGPQPALLDLLLERLDRPLPALLPQLVEDRLDRPDLLAHEGAHPVQLLLELRVGGEVPCHAFDHGRTSPPKWGNDPSASCRCCSCDLTPLARAAGRPGQPHLPGGRRRRLALGLLARQPDHARRSPPSP